jgi:hypothetical protein
MNIPIYVSLTTIYKNQREVLKSLESILNQTIKIDKIYLYLSEDKYLLDEGFRNKEITNKNLLDFINDYDKIEIRWVKNEGPYRKLLPVLKDKWEEDCIIITIDDDTIYDKRLIENMVNDYNKYKCVISYRGFTPKMAKFRDFDYETRDKLCHLHSFNFCTGKGGILYKPEFFYKTKDLIFNDRIYLNKCKTNDDIWFYILRVINNVKAYVDTKKYMTRDLQTNGLYFNYNKKNNNNTRLFKETMEELGR